jgi:hypothetical protein
MVQDQVERFRTGEVGILQMWTQIDDRLDRALRGEDPQDPFEDDKAERRVPPLARKNGSVAD